MMRPEQIQFRDVISKQQRDRPVEYDPKSPAPARHLHEVIRPPNPPRDKSPDLQFEDATDALVVSEARQHSQRAIDERFERGGWVANGGDDVARQDARFAQGVLRQRRIWIARWIGDVGAIAQRPDLRPLLRA